MLEFAIGLTDSELSLLTEDELALIEWVIEDSELPTPECDFELEPLLGTGNFRYPLHEGQRRAWLATEDIVAILAGKQSGKTIFGPHWLLREIQRMGPGEYGVISPNYSLLARRALPELKKVLRGMGKVSWHPTPRFVFNERGLRMLFGFIPDVETVIYLCHAKNSEALESMTLKAAWADECGQKQFARTSFEALVARLAVNNGRLLLTTTPYEWNWLKTDIYDQWLAGAAFIAVINFDSLANPAFPRERYERAKASMPLWRFKLFFLGQFTRPAGQIYDCFEETRIPYDGVIPPLGYDSNVCEGFEIPLAWPHIEVGVDFGPLNTAATFLAEELEAVNETTWGRPTGRYFLFNSYHGGKKKGKDHAKTIVERAGCIPRAYGGSPTEDGARESFNFHGLHVQKPVEGDVEVGISYVYGAIQARALIVFRHLEKVLGEIRTYSRELDDDAETTEKIKDKSKFHRMDCLRYSGCKIFRDFAPEAPMRRFEARRGQGGAARRFGGNQ